MRALTSVRRLIEEHPAEPNARFFQELLGSLEHGRPISLSEMYELDYHDFELALDTLREWRLHRYAFVLLTSLT